MDYSRYKTLLTERRGRVLTITMNRPQALNAVNAALHEDLSRVFEDVRRDRGTDVAVLTGAGRAFSAGGDLRWMQEAIDDPENFEKVADEARWIVYSILDCDKPVICRLNGDAIGLGATVALFCDIIIAADTARIGDPHVSVGLVAGDGGTIIWPQLIGYARAKEFLFTGELITAPDAARIGLINHSVPVDELDSRVNAMADRLAAGATKAIRWTKRAVNSPLRQIAHAAMDSAIALESLSNLTRDHQEAVTAFGEKRKPRFTGR